MKGLLVFVYRSAGGDCTNGGKSSNYNEMILVGDGIPEIFETDGSDALVIKEMNIGNKTYYHAVPYYNGNRHTMFGGNFIHTSDSRFPFDYPIPVHDRVE